MPTDKREPHDYICPECGGRSELVRRGFQPPEIEVHHFAGCKYEGIR